jgi:hypothetical protein
MNPRAGLDDMEKRKYFTLPGLELPLPLVVQPVASRYTDSAIPAHPIPGTLDLYGLGLLGYSLFSMVSTYHPLVECGIKISYFIYKGNVSSVQLQHVIGDSKSSGEIDRLRFHFIDFQVPALTPRILYSESALQFAENATFVFLLRVNIGIIREKSQMNSRCRRVIIYV